MEHSRIDFSRLRFLLVENHALMRRLLLEMLRGFGVRQVRQAENVPNAFSAIYREPFDAVILDFFLGDMDGADFAWRVRHDPQCRNRKVPILLVTGLPEHQKVLKVRDAGVNGILVKPVAPKDLYVRLEDMLARPRPFVVTKSYVGPDHSPEIRRAIAARAAATLSPPAEKRRLSLWADEADGVLLLKKRAAPPDREKQLS